MPSRRAGSEPLTGIAAACLWLLWPGAAGLSTARSAARSRRWSLPTCWLAGLLLLALALALGLGGVAAPLALVPVILALLLAGALGSSAAAGQPGAIGAALGGLPGRDGLLATGSRTRGGRAYPPTRPTVR